MSRIGKLPIKIPAGVTAKQNNDQIVVTGPMGSLSCAVAFPVTVVIQEHEVVISIPDELERKANSLWGLHQRLISNMVIGVTKGYQKQLEINGVGFRASVSGSTLTLNVGFSHPVEFSLPHGISATVEKNMITISGADKQVVGEIAATIRRIRPPEPYKGKGIKYSQEIIRRKAGKQATKK